MVYVASLSHHIERGTTVEIEEVTFRHLCVDHLGDWLFGAMSHVQYDWMYSVRWGRVDPDWGFADRSLGHLLFSLSQWCGTAFGSWNKRKKIASFPVTPEWVREHMPELGWPWDGSELDCEEDSQ
jgi:hypothetical protein